MQMGMYFFFFFSSRRRHTRWTGDWSSDVCSSDLGLVGAIPLVTQCGEPQAKEGTCATSSQIGTATVQAGAGSTPFTFSGPVYLTGPYNGAPFGMSIAVAAIAGPFNLGVV